MSWLRIREFIRKEFIVLFRDKRNLPLIIVAPIIQLFVFGYVVNYDINYISIALLDQARTQESRMLVNSFTAGGVFHVTNRVKNEHEMERLLLTRKVDLGVKIAPDMSSLIKEGKTAAVQIIADGGMSNMAAVRVAYAVVVLDKVNRQLIQEIYPMEMHYGQIDARLRSWYNPNSYSRYFFIPGIVAFIIMLISLLFTSIAIIREKEAGTMEQLIVTPLKPGELIIGKTIPYIIISLAQMVVVMLLAVFWFGIPIMGNVWLLPLAASLFLLSTLGIGLFISTVSATQQQAMMTTFFFAVPFIMLSGFIFPIANMPVFVQWLTYLNPLRYFLIIVRGVFLKGVGLSVLWPEYVAMTILGIIVFTTSVLRFRKRLD